MGEGEGEEETSFEAQHGDDTWEASALPDRGLDWKDKVEIHTLCSVIGKQMVSQAWIFNSPHYFPPQGSSFPPVKAHVPMGNTMENSGHC